MMFIPFFCADVKNVTLFLKPTRDKIKLIHLEPVKM